MVQLNPYIDAKIAAIGNSFNSKMVQLNLRLAFNLLIINLSFNSKMVQLNLYQRYEYSRGY